MMPAQRSHEAEIPNPALKAFGVLVGEWITTGSHPYLPGKALHGRASFEWIEGGAFLAIHSEIDEPEIPTGVAIIGSDDATGEYSMLYFDERGVSRHYQVAMRDNVLSWWRDAPDFSQRFQCEIADDGRTMVGKGEMSRNGGEWERDLELTYRRVDAQGKR